jgi:hypothetical protein
LWQRASDEQRIAVTRAVIEQERLERHLKFKPDHHDAA